MEKNKFSTEEKNEVIDYCIETVEFYFTNITGPCCCYIVTDDSYMKKEIARRILNLNMKNFLSSKEIVEFDGIKYINDDSMLTKINQVTFEKDKLIFITHIKEYDEWYIKEHPEIEEKIGSHPTLSRMNYMRDSIFNDNESQIIFLLNQQEDIIFMRYALDFWTQIDYRCDLDHVLKNDLDHVLKWKNTNSSEEKTKKSNK